MNRRILDIARSTINMFSELDRGELKEDILKISDARDSLRNSIEEIKSLDWDNLLATDDETRQKLIVCQQKAVESYAKLKRVLLETYRDTFNAIKKF
jgi:hypothetical protein